MDADGDAGDDAGDAVASDQEDEPRKYQQKSILIK